MGTEIDDACSMGRDSLFRLDFLVNFSQPGKCHSTCCPLASCRSHLMIAKAASSSGCAHRMPNEYFGQYFTSLSATGGAFFPDAGHCFGGISHVDTPRVQRERLRYRLRNLIRNSWRVDLRFFGPMMNGGARYYGTTARGSTGARGLMPSRTSGKSNE